MAAAATAYRPARRIAAAFSRLPLSSKPFSTALHPFRHTSNCSPISPVHLPRTPPTSTPRIPSLYKRTSATAIVPPQPQSSSPPLRDAYQPPTTGILSHFPPSWVPYACRDHISLSPMPLVHTSRFHAHPRADISPAMLGTTALFATGAVIMRGAGCTINDFLDREFDPLVRRTKFRPIARGAITPVQAVKFLSVQLLAGAGVLFSLPVECIYWGIPSLLLVSTYPLAKRVTHYPHFVLGLAFSWGALLGFPAMGLSLSDPTILATAGCLYASNVAWTALYDTIYAHQDVADDVKAGVKSIAVKHEHDTKKIMTGLGAVQLCFLSAAGVLAGCGPVFFVGSCGGAAVGLGWMIYRARLKVWCAVVVGGVAIGGGMMGEYLAQRFGLYEKNKQKKAIEA
ncbi:UbiA prenyltransferase family-domain-containing protein [Kalaharituber pfeilii]|nr:UbiA prenyltransferase family-domain-containing protein [Kalaharituber pfeilii]